VSGKKLMAR
jgi:asparagine synthetase B (glutamine-hydrolysing)